MVSNELCAVPTPLKHGVAALVTALLHGSLEHRRRSRDFERGVYGGVSSSVTDGIEKGVKRGSKVYGWA